MKPLAILKLINCKINDKERTVNGSSKKFRANNSKFFVKNNLYDQLIRIMHIKTLLYPNSCKSTSETLAPAYPPKLMVL